MDRDLLWVRGGGLFEVCRRFCSPFLSGCDGVHRRATTHSIHTNHLPRTRSPSRLAFTGGALRDMGHADRFRTFLGRSSRRASVIAACATVERIVAQNVFHWRQLDFRALDNVGFPDPVEAQARARFPCVALRGGRSVRSGGWVACMR